MGLVRVCFKNAGQLVALLRNLRLLSDDRAGTRATQNSASKKRTARQARRDDIGY